ncbi:MAG: glycosyltransferase [Kiritimatiellae bacterium]|nr:glycosyltransferase [Kiritimatiellia bacterium]
MSDIPPRVSVIIPTYNRADFIGRAVDSVLGQRYPNVELIVVDDGSTDGTRARIAAAYGERVKYIGRENGGAPKARNEGFRASTGEFIHFLDSDDYLLPGSIEKKAAILAADPQIDWVYSDYYVSTDGRQLSPSPFPDRLRRELETMTDIFDVTLLKRGLANTDTAMMRRRCIEEAGGFDERLEGLQDCEFYLRIAKHFRVKFINEPLAVYVIHGGERIQRRRDPYKAILAYTEIVKERFPDDVRRLKWPRPGRRTADVHNYLGKDYLGKGMRREARAEFLRSIGCFPLQRQVWWLLLKTVL